MKQLIIFTDLDGTLLDYSTYSFAEALPALRIVNEKNIPLIICSSKTRREIEHYRKQLGNRHPFVSENGGGIFLPLCYFKCVLSPDSSREGGLDILRLGAAYTELRQALTGLKREGFSIRGFGDMTAEEVARLANMSLDEAEMAKDRDFDEPFVFEGQAEEIPNLIAVVRDKGFHVTRGRFFHVLGDSDKGKAASILTDLYRKTFGDLFTAAIGDSENDIPMLEGVDYPVIVRKPDGRHDPRITVANIIREDGIGPQGWNIAVMKIIEDRALQVSASTSG